MTSDTFADLSASAARVRTLLNPKTVCVIGASEKPNTGSHRIFKHLAQSSVNVIPVNPKASEILGRKCYASIGDIPEPVDQAFIILARPLADQVVKDCIAKGVSSIVLVTGGYAEVSPEGAKAQELIHQQCAEAGVTLLGPNCYGYVNNVANVSGSGAAILSNGPLKRGRVGICSQSGGMGIAVFPWALERHGSGVSHAVNVGNQCDIDLADVVAFLAEDGDTSTILLHAEGVTDGRKLARAAGYAHSKGKFVVYLKVGFSEFGQEAALAHTGVLGGADKVFEGVMKSVGAARFVGCEETAFAAHLNERLHGRRLGPRIAIVSPSGGAVAQAVDVFGRKEHLRLADLSPATTEYLGRRLSAVSHVANPVDLTLQAIADPTTFADCSKALLADDGVDVVVVVITMNKSWEPVVSDIVALSQTAQKPLLLLWIGTELEGSSMEQLLNASRLPWTQSEIVLAEALNSFVSHLQAQPDAARKKKPVRTARVHDEVAVGAQLRDASFALPQGVVVVSAQDAVRASRESSLGFPVIAKGLVAGITHKKKGGVLWMGLKTDDDIGRAAREFFLAHPQGRLLLQETVSFEREWMVGFKKDASFGAVMLFGAGGVDVEAINDVGYAQLPLTGDSAIELVQSCRAARSMSPQQAELMSHLLLRLSSWMAQTPYDEIDLNPVVIDRSGRAVILDALAIAYPDEQA